MKISTIVMLLVLVLIIVFGVYYVSNNNVTPTTNQQVEPTSTTPTTSGSTQTTSELSPTINKTQTKTPTVPATIISKSVIIANFAFSPSDLTIKKGTKVIWTNQDSVIHTVTMDNEGVSSGNIKQGASYSYTFNLVGTFNYHCAVHPNMHGVVYVIN